MSSLLVQPLVQFTGKAQGGARRGVELVYIFKAWLKDALIPDRQGTSYHSPSTSVLSMEGPSCNHYTDLLVLPTLLGPGQP